jgi:two-component system sensor histidine kinase/response regulator
MSHTAYRLAGSYDYRLVGLSILIAISASYTALRLGSRTTAAVGATRRAWLTCGAVSMGFGIWSMHYVGMLAFTVPAPILYDVPMVLVSLLAAIFASAVALFVVSREVVTTVDTVVGSVCMGGGILAMHYVGMEAMRGPVMCDYDPLLVGLSGIIAIGGSLAALWLTFRFRAVTTGVSPWKALSAVAMGIAIAAMHYTGMAAASFHLTGESVDYAHAVSVSALGVTGVVAVTFLLLGFAVFSSITDQRLAEHRALAEELYISRQMLQSILDNVPQRVFWKDRNGYYLGCNQAFANDAGLASPEEVAGKTDTELPWREEWAFAEFRTAAQNGTPVLNSECQRPGVDGEQRWLRANSVPLRDSQQDVFGVLGTYEDITDRKRAEDAIKRSNTALSEFAHVVSHDLQSPVRVARNYTQLVVKRYGKQLDEPGRGFLQFVEDSLGNMDELIRSLLRYAAATEPDPGGRTQILLEDALQRALANLGLLIKETHAEVAHDRLPVVNAYPTQLTQIFQNLIANSIKYRKSGIAPNIHVGAAEDLEEWVVCVRDNGIGIAPENRQRIFAPLERLHGKEIPGFGIGLATCQRVVEHHGGKIWVESQLGVGSAFYFTLRKSRNGNSQQAVEGRNWYEQRA